MNLYWIEYQNSVLLNYVVIVMAHDMEEAMQKVKKRYGNDVDFLSIQKRSYAPQEFKGIMK